jgi:hypothetical protein
MEMTTMWAFLGRRRAAAPPLTERQRTLVATKLALLRQATEGFTGSRLLHLQGPDASDWSSACTTELRRQVGAAAPADVEPLLLDFPSLRCLSLQCRHVRAPAGAGAAPDRSGAVRN